MRSAARDADSTEERQREGEHWGSAEQAHKRCKERKAGEGEGKQRKGQHEAGGMPGFP